MPSDHTLIELIVYLFSCMLNFDYIIMKIENIVQRISFLSPKIAISNIYKELQSQFYLSAFAVSRIEQSKQIVSFFNDICLKILKNNEACMYNYSSNNEIDFLGNIIHKFMFNCKNFSPFCSLLISGLI